jgi:hypothetical protein
VTRSRGGVLHVDIDAAPGGSADHPAHVRCPIHGESSGDSTIFVPVLATAIAPGPRAGSSTFETTARGNGLLRSAA